MRAEQERHMYLLHKNVTGLRTNLDTAHTVAASKVQNHLNDNQNLLKEVNNLRFEVRNLSMENQRLSSRLEFNARMQGSRKKAQDGSEGSELEPMFPQYHHQHQQLHHTQPSDHKAHGGHQDPPRINWDSVDSAGNSEELLMSAAELPSFDSNGYRNDDGAFFNRLRDGSGEVVGKAGRKGPKGAVPRHVSKSASAPFFSVKGMHSDAQLEGARLALGATVSGAPLYPDERSGHATGRSSVQPEFSVASKRTITGVPSYSSQLDALGGSIQSNKNEYQRSADDKIAALMELNEQQIRAYREEQSKHAKSNANAPNKGSKSKPIHIQSVASDLSRGEASLELLGGPVPVDGSNEGLALSFSLTSDGSSGIQLPNIRKSKSNLSTGSANSRKK